MTNIDTRYSEELAWCAGLLSGDRAKVKMTGAGNEADYLEVQALGARRHGQRDESIAFQAAANHWRDGSHKSAIEILRQAIAPDTFKSMSDKELQAFIESCHKARSFDTYFERACLEWNNRPPSAASSNVSLLMLPDPIVCNQCGAIGKPYANCNGRCDIA